MAFSDYKDLLPTTRVVSMSDVGKVSHRPKSTPNTISDMSMAQRIDEYIAKSKHDKDPSAHDIAISEQGLSAPVSDAASTFNVAKLATQKQASTKKTTQNAQVTKAVAKPQAQVRSQAPQDQSSQPYAMPDRQESASHTAANSLPSANDRHQSSFHDPVFSAHTAATSLAPAYTGEHIDTHSYGMEKHICHGARANDAYTQVWQEYDAILGAYDEAHLERVDASQIPSNHSAVQSHASTASTQGNTPLAAQDTSAYSHEQGLNHERSHAVDTNAQTSAQTISTKAQSTNSHASQSHEARSDNHDLAATKQLSAHTHDGVVVSEDSALSTHVTSPQTNSAHATISPRSSVDSQVSAGSHDAAGSRSSVSAGAHDAVSLQVNTGAQDAVGYQDTISNDDDELDFDGILEAYEALQSESDADEHYSSLKGKDLSSGKGMPLLENQGGYGRALRATDSTEGFSDEVSPWEQGIPEELRKFLKNKPEDEDSGPK